MYDNFCRDGIDYITDYLKSIGRLQNDFKYMTYSIHKGSLTNIAIVEFTTYPPDCFYPSFVIDILDYISYYRGLKIKHLKGKMI